MNKNIKLLLESVYSGLSNDDIYYSVKTDSLRDIIKEIEVGCYQAGLKGIKSIQFDGRELRKAKQKFGGMTTTIGWVDNFQYCNGFDDYKLFYIYVRFKDNRLIYFGNYELGRQQHTLMDGEELNSFKEYINELKRGSQF